MLSEQMRRELRQVVGELVDAESEQAQETARFTMVELVERWLDAARSEAPGLDLADVELLANLVRATAYSPENRDAAERVLAALEGRK